MAEAGEASPESGTPPPSSRLPRLSSKLIMIPYLIGIGWFLLHPIVSVVTGEPKCRGVYTDEHQFDLKTFYTDKYPLDQIAGRRKRLKNYQSDDGSLNNNNNACQILDVMKTQFEYEYEIRREKDDDADDDKFSAPFNPFRSPYISCFDARSRSPSSYSIIKIKPSLAPTESIEALVLVIPPTKNWFNSLFHITIISFIERMATVPWLAKDILILQPNYHNENDNDATIKRLGSRSGSEVGNVVEDFMEDLRSASLPISFTHYLIRQLIVVEMNHDAKKYNRNQYQNQFAILTQGHFGTVPNLDLISGVTKSMEQTFGREILTRTRMHPFEMEWWSTFVHQQQQKHMYSSQMKEWGLDLGNMVAFMMAFWKPAPHAAALAEGIDSLTIQLQLANDSSSSNKVEVVQMVQLVQHLFRGLNNLSERLHHNVNQYILPSATKFVSHGEYIVPAILIMLPLLLRKLKLLLQDFVLAAVPGEDGGEERERKGRVSLTNAVIGGVVIATIPFYCQHLAIVTERTTIIIAIAVYTIAMILVLRPRWVKRATANPRDRSTNQQRLQLIVCMLTLCTHVPLALSHYSLFMASAPFWVPLVSFLDYGDSSSSRWISVIIRRLVGVCLLGLGMTAAKMAYQESIDMPLPPVSAPILPFPVPISILPLTIFTNVVVLPLHFLVVVLSFA